MRCSLIQCSSQSCLHCFTLIQCCYNTYFTTHFRFGSTSPRLFAHTLFPNDQKSPPAITLQLDNGWIHGYWIAIHFSPCSKFMVSTTSFSVLRFTANEVPSQWDLNSIASDFSSIAWHMRLSQFIYFTRPFNFATMLDFHSSIWLLNSLLQLTRRHLYPFI